MAEETQETVAQNQEVAAAPVQQQAVPTPERSFKMPSGLGQMLKGNDRGEFEKKKAEFEKAAQAAQPTPAAPTEQLSQAATTAAAPSTEKVVEAAKPAEQPAAAPTASEVTKNRFGLGKNKAEETLIGSEKELLEVINKSFGYELKELKDTSKFIETTKDWRTKAQKVEEVEKNNKQYEELWNSLPEPIVEAAKLWANGDDYKKPFINQPNFDFDKPVDKQDKIELAKHYFPKQFSKLTEDEIADAKDGILSDKLEPIVEASLERFKTQQEARNNQRAAQLERATQAQKAFKQSVNSSVDYLKQTFPDMDADMIKEASTIVSGGQQEIQKLFFNNDGTLKKEAAKLITMAKYGEEEMRKLATISAHIAETKANEDIVTRGADQPKPKKTGNSTGDEPKISKEAAELIKRAQQTGSGNRKTF